MSKIGTLYGDIAQKIYNSKVSYKPRYVEGRLVLDVFTVEQTCPHCGEYNFKDEIVDGRCHECLRNMEE